MLHVIDASDPNYLEHVATTNAVLEEIGVKDIPMLYLYNKVDLGGYTFVQAEEPHLFISAKYGQNLESLYQYIRKTLYQHAKRVQLWIPYESGEILSSLYQKAEIISEKYEENGIYLVAEVLPSQLALIEDYYIKN